MMRNEIPMMFGELMSCYVVCAIILLPESLNLQTLDNATSSPDSTVQSGDTIHTFMVSPPVMNVTALESEAECKLDAWGGGGGRCRLPSLAVISLL